MKPRIGFTFIPALLVMLFIATAHDANAADVRVSIGGGRHWYGYREYRTFDPVYTTWYPDYSTTYVYPDTVYSDDYYTVPYVYSSPSIEFNTWYGGGYRNRSGVYFGGRNGYSGGFRSGRGTHTGGGHHR